MFELQPVADPSMVCKIRNFVEAGSDSVISLGLRFLALLEVKAVNQRHESTFGDGKFSFEIESKVFFFNFN